MRDTLPFLQRLGLDDDTDARSIRRAYARELKLIDQERDSAGFQELREAYDAALRWSSWREQQAAQQPAPAPESTAPDYGMARTPVTLAVPPADAAETPPSLTLEDPQAAAAAVFDEFHAAIKQLAQQRHAQNSAEWQRTLQHSLDDQRLLNVTARIYFEAHIAHLLATGWQPGHEILFVAACKVFHWSDDRRRLRQLGHAGMQIDRAVDEYTMFERLPESELMLHRAALSLLRKDSQPTDYQLRGDMPYVEFLVQHFPAWMSMVVDVNVVEQWRASFRALPPLKKSWWPKLSIDISSRMGWVLVVVAFQLLRMCWNSADNTPAPHFRPAEYFPSPSTGMPGHQPLPEYIRQDIAARIPTLPLQLGPGVHRAEFAVTLDQQGKLYQIMMYTSSGSISYDEAVSKALHDSQPFPPEAPRKFEVTFTIPTP
jgi:protein TonB